MLGFSFYNAVSPDTIFSLSRLTDWLTDLCSFPFQAALGPVALDEVRKLHLEEYEGYANTVLIIAVLSILITAPVGAILITVLGPRLLEKEEQEVVIDGQMPGQNHINLSVESTVAA